MGKPDHSPPALAERSALTRELLHLRATLQQLHEQNEELLENQDLLESSRDDFAELYDGSPHPLLTLGPAGTIRTANLAAAELLGRERSWLVGRSFPLLVRELDRATAATALSADSRLKIWRAKLMVHGGAQVPVQLSRRLSIRRQGVSHLSLLDLRPIFAFEAAWATAPGVTHAPRRILLIEDEPDTAEVMQEVLERNGYWVVPADCVETAAQIDPTHVDAIVSDIMLPDGTATDLLRRVKQVRELPAIAFSGLAKTADIERARRAGFDLYLTKPVDFPQLLAALGTMLAADAESTAYQARVPPC